MGKCLFTMGYSFKNDYSEGAHPRVLEALTCTNAEQTDGYGTDDYCARARERVRTLCNAPKADVHFLVGGTQANMTVIAASLRPHQAVLAAHTGHICVHETGAIETTGHKAIGLASLDGRLSPKAAAEALAAHPDEHMVQPKMVYISDTTEIGTTYTLGQLEELSAFCRANGLWLYLDGARLAMALADGRSGVTLPDLARLCDVFTIGGTKCGALFGEAVVITNDALKPDFRYHIKQRGGMLAKGRLLGLQFEALLADNLYTELGAHANAMGRRLRDLFTENDYPMMSDSLTNQQFAVLPDRLIEALRAADYRFELQMRVDETHCAMRFVTSWATPEAAVEQFADDFLRLARQCGA